MCLYSLDYLQSMTLTTSMHIIQSVAGLAFKQTSDSVVLFVVTTEAVLSYNTSAKDRRVSHDGALSSCTLL